MLVGLDFNVEKKVLLNNLTAKEIESKLSDLVKAPASQ
jgi:hypothetical protein